MAKGSHSGWLGHPLRECSSCGKRVTLTDSASWSGWIHDEKPERPILLCRADFDKYGIVRRGKRS